MKVLLDTSGESIKKSCSEVQVVCESESEEVEAGEVILPFPLPFTDFPNHSHFHHLLEHQKLPLPLFCLLRQASCLTLTSGCGAYQALLKKGDDAYRKKEHREARLRSHASCSTPKETRNVCSSGTRRHSKERCHRDVSRNEHVPGLSIPFLHHHSAAAGGQLTGGLHSEIATTAAATAAMTTVEGIEVIREIGRGNYGSVWLVRRPDSCRNLVLKCVELTHASATEVEAARQEVHILAGLRHPNIVSYKGSFEVGRQLNLLMGYCAGGDMASLIRRQRGHLFPEVKIVRWLIQITMALQYLHSHNILHRDLKTRNIFLTRSGLIKLGDFGIARILGSSQDMATTLIGTPYYMSPELFAGLPYNHKSDVWALGCCLYELATLRHAFPARDIPGLISKISKGKIVGLNEQYSDDLRHLVLSLMTRSPEHRPSASQVLRFPYIRQHMALFLKDTSDAEEITGSEKSSIEEKQRLPDVLQDLGVCGVEPSREGGQSTVASNERVGQHKHSVARRCCEITPSEFESLQIAGDKIKLEERDRGEAKPSGIKECQCPPRREKQQHLPSSTGHLSSQSRARRRGSKEMESSGTSDQEHQSPAAFTPPRSSLSARERRRQQRIRETEISSISTEVRGHLEEEKSGSADSCPQSSTEDSDEYSNSDTNTATLPHEYEEEEEFLQSLSSTLTEASNSSEGENEQMDDGTEYLEAKIIELEEYLVTKLGKVQGRLIMKVLKEEQEDDEVQGNWEVRLREVEQLVGSKLEPKVATTAWHLHLCYVFQHT